MGGDGERWMGMVMVIGGWAIGKVNEVGGMLKTNSLIHTSGLARTPVPPYTHPHPHPHPHTGCTYTHTQEGSSAQ